MENNTIEEESIYTKVEQSLKDRMTTYITESKLTGNKETDSFRKLIEVSVDKFMIENPIATKQN